MTEAAHFHVPGEAKGKGRPRFNTKTGRAFTPSKTVAAEMRVREAWRTAGESFLGDGPVVLTLQVLMRRPRSHYRANGELNATGLRSRVPVKKPDLDNTLKLVADALNGLAYRDDAQIVEAHVSKCWADEDPEGVFVSVQRVAVEVVA